MIRGPYRRSRTTSERFWSKVDKSGECWIWTASRTRAGYGWFAPEHGKHVSAHCWAYQEAHGPVPAGLTLDHLCRNRACVNPQHLQAVTHAENIRRGSSTNLTASDVAAIRQLRADGLGLKEIASRFGVVHTTISRVCTGKRWSAR